ncbi:FAD/FMN-containing dehydrogenase [Catalinimonas alkaloidigena]|uniref:FAD/FMN-containing dehydrogenase n=1 Tax=Catalinimonas alkaloidigena TaxID=1075417 RepID=A0A1G9SGZ5_9BACT|nr:FAD-binding protein [Catalinimonas alkaloidigena]SDM34600.1 FAD/FMN-containing dehydrogenase [Catalinimonas alkaloidigena]
MNARLASISKTRVTWKNTTRNVEVSPLRYFFPRQVDDLVAIVQDADAHGLRVRAVGSGHSFSEVAKGRDYLLNMQYLDKVAQVDPQGLHERHRGQGDNARYYVEAEAGITIKNLNIVLDGMGLALLNMGAVNFQTVSGALATATHGSGITMPAFPDMVRSILLVTGGGQLIRLEPADGITDPATFTPRHGEALVQDDDLFYSTLVSFGAMGIMYALTLEVVPAFMIKEQRVMMDWNVLREELIRGDFIEKVVRNYDYVSFRVNPYEVDGQHLCSVVLQEIIPGPPKLSLNARYKNLKTSILGNIPLLPLFTIWYLNRFPKAIPGSINSFLKGTKDKIFIGKSYRTLFQSGTNIRRHGISSEFAFPVDGALIVSVVETIFRQALENVARGNLYQSSHIPVRFVPASQAYLSTAYGRETAYVDIPLLQNTVGDYEILERYQDLIFTHGGIPHWGKINNRLYGKIDITQKNFPRLGIWQRVRAQLDPKGTFISVFMEQAELIPRHLDTVAVNPGVLHEE